MKDEEKKINKTKWANKKPKGKQKVSSKAKAKTDYEDNLIEKKHPFDNDVNEVYVPWDRDKEMYEHVITSAEDKKMNKTKLANKVTGTVILNRPKTKLKNNEDDLLYEIIRWGKDKKKAEKAIEETKKDVQKTLEEIKIIQSSIESVQRKVAKRSENATWSWIKGLFYNK